MMKTNVSIKDYDNYFNATALEKVNTERRGPKIYPTKGEFSPALHKLLTTRRNWGPTFQFRGRSTFMMGVMEWTKRVLTRFEEPLKQAGIFGVVGVSQFPYHFDANVWQAFGKLCGPQTNTLHHGASEVSHNKYPAAVAELLCVRAELCELHKAKHIYYDLWLDHFY
ncbi:LOW QUALITY PROTEIN: hypothetical protein Cgig2_004870 [Carnegiea gigantea]|uniref:Uncharacterized protein n=1 Tax=Carnegiea gigantea TaxID=171969 RepID=A0A9Q1JY47_9CARY|nr:LOW QUALITY PROTEIN: hypothetical protein Cgig2_004870 [Carnegiea gigantea]